MAQLLKGMYGGEFSRKEGPFGLASGQMHGGSKISHNSGWYNKAGEKLGFGDLSGEDMARIARELEQGEVFVVLGEHDSFWNHRKNGIPEMEPGVDYVVKHALYAVAPGHTYTIDRYGDKKEVPSRTICDHEFLYISQKDLKRLMVTGRRPD